MMNTEAAKRVVDYAAMPASAGAYTLSHASEFASILTPILTAVLIAVSIAWYVWRMVDRVRFGPSKGRGDE